MKRSVVKIFLLLLCAQATVTLAYPTIKNDPLPLASQTNGVVETDAMRAYLEVQAQLHATQITLERNQQDAEAAAARSSQDLADRIQRIQNTMIEQRARDLQAMQSSNRVILIVAGTFAGLGFLAMLFTAYFQWKGVARLTEITLAASPAHASPDWGMQTFESGTGSPMDSVARLLAVIDRLEKRILQLENTAQPSLPNASQTGIAAPAEVNENTGRITLLLAKGQSLLNLDKNEDAVACFDEVLALDQNNTDALVKKGVALERQRKLNEAIECYDKAIAADRSVTIAYLYKGGVFNRLERFDEALQCYEQALHAQENGTTS